MERHTVKLITKSVIADVQRAGIEQRAWGQVTGPVLGASAGEEFECRHSGQGREAGEGAPGGSGVCEIKAVVTCQSLSDLFVPPT